MLILSKNIGVASLRSVGIISIMLILSKSISVHIPATHLHHAVIPTTRCHHVNLVHHV